MRKTLVCVLFAAMLCMCLTPVGVSTNAAVTPYRLSFADENFAQSVIPVYMQNETQGVEEDFDVHWSVDEAGVLRREGDLFGEDVTASYAVLYLKDVRAKYFELETQVIVGEQGLEGVIFGTNNMFVRHMAEGKAVYFMPDPCVELSGNNLVQGSTSPNFAKKPSYKLRVKVFGGNVEIYIENELKVKQSYDEGLFDYGRVGLFTANTNGGFCEGITLWHLNADGDRIEAPDYVAVTGIEIASPTISMDLSGGAVNLSYTVFPANATEQSLRFLAENPDVVAVDSAFQIHPLREGTTLLHLYTVDGGYCKGLTVTVTKAEVLLAGVTLSKSTILAKTGETHYLEASVYPEEAENDGFKWSSSDTSVAIVNNGTVLILGEGNCTITVKDASGSYAATCEVTVQAEKTFPMWIVFAGVALLILGGVAALLLVKMKKGGRKGV